MNGNGESAMSTRINQRGEALIIVLFCSVVAFLFVMAVVFMINRGQQSSGMEKRYRSALDAADSGVSLSVQLLDDKKLAISNDTANFFTAAINYNPAPGSCLYQKLTTPTATSSTDKWPACTPNQESLDDMGTADVDMAFTVQSAGSTNTQYDVVAKIVDSRRGVTLAAPGNFQSGGVVNSEGVVTPVELPYFYYTVQVLGRTHGTNNEAAHLTYIYAD